MKKLRQLKVESLIKREIAMLVLTQVKNPKVKFVTVSGVNMSTDMRIAHVFVSVMGDEEAKQRALKGLKQASGFIRGKIGDVLNLRYCPDIVFELDRAVDEHARIDGLLKQIEDEKKEKEKNDGEKKDE
jgi:ribosome-binding factor A